jgi:hypothetical protein
VAFSFITADLDFPLGMMDGWKCRMHWTVREDDEGNERV